MVVQKFFLMAVLLVAVSSLSATVAGASTKASPENCASAGSAVVHCYDCVNNKYLGKASVLLGYEEFGGEGYCIVANDAKNACSSRYGVDRNAIGFYSKFRIGGGSRDETYDTSCIDRVGKP